MEACPKYVCRSGDGILLNLGRARYVCTESAEENT